MCLPEAMRNSASWWSCTGRSSSTTYSKGYGGTATLQLVEYAVLQKDLTVWLSKAVDTVGRDRVG